MGRHIGRIDNDDHRADSPRTFSPAGGSLLFPGRRPAGSGCSRSWPCWRSARNRRPRRSRPSPAFDGRRHVYVGAGHPRRLSVDRGADRSAREGHAGLSLLRRGRPIGGAAHRDGDPRLRRRALRSLAAAGRRASACRWTRRVRSSSSSPSRTSRSPSTPGPRSADWACSGESDPSRRWSKPSGFVKIARGGRYPEAITALLNRTDQWIADPRHDHPATRPPPRSPRSPQPDPRRPNPAWPCRPRRHRRHGGRNLAVGLGLFAPRRSSRPSWAGSGWSTAARRGRLDQRIKEIRSRATDVMDRLDALKERLKLLPAIGSGLPGADGRRDRGPVREHPGGRRQALGSMAPGDGLARPGPEAGRSASHPPSRGRPCMTPRRCWNRKALFEEIDAGVQACAADMDRLNQAHEAARGELEAVGVGEAEGRRPGRGDPEARTADRALSGGAGRHRRRGRQGARR